MTEMEMLRLYLKWLKELMKETLIGWAYIWGVFTILYIVKEALHG